VKGSTLGAFLCCFFSVDFSTCPVVVGAEDAFTMILPTQLFYFEQKLLDLVPFDFQLPVDAGDGESGLAPWPSLNYR
jgi:hypothetical protein